ncbi:O-antigen ligase family protein [Candidatus Bipolaricaulota bacterium]|nr:O-antigen ligase family protein [Candidatus Bipolaricaulota bacterium]
MPKKAKKRKERRISRPSWLSRLRQALLIFLLATQPLFFSAWNTEYGYTKSVYTLVLVSIILILWAWEMLRNRETKVELSWLSPILPALLLAAFLSLTGQTPACTVLQSAALILFFGFIFLFIINAPEQSHPWILGALVFSSCLNALLGLLQYLGIAPGGLGGRGPSAMIATMGNQQFLAGFLSYLILPGLIFLRAKKGWIIAVLALGFNFAVMLLTQQIGVRLGLGAALVFVSFGLGFWRAKLPPWEKLVVVGLIGLAALGGVLKFSGLLASLALALGAVGLYFLGRALRRVPLLWLAVIAGGAMALILLLPVITPLSAVRDLWARKSGAIRAWDWWVGYEMWKDYPLFGIGLGGYKIYFVPYKPKFLASPRGAGYAFPFPRADQAHNEYVQVAAELGTFGFLVFLSGLALLAHLGLGRLSRLDNSQKKWELLLLGGGLITALVHAAPTFPFHLPASSLAFVAILGLALSPRYGPFGSLYLALGKRTRGLLASFLILLSLVVSVFAVRDIVADGYLLSAQASYYLGELDLAEQKIARAVELDFCPRVSLYWYGLIKAGLGKLAEAKEAFQRCLTHYRPEALYLNLAAVHLQLGEPEGAEELLTELLATIPPREMAQDARYYLAVAELQRGDVLSAKTWVDEVLRVDPNHERAWLLLGELQRRRYLWDEAKKAFQQALKVIDAKLQRINEQLSRPLPLKDFGELRAQKESLTQMRATALKALGELP